MRRLYLLLLFIISGLTVRAQIVISEIMYNDPSPGDTLEYIELVNNGSSFVNLQNYHFGLGVSYTFPSVSLAPGAFVIIAKDSVAIKNYFNKSARQWYSGALNNTGEPITLRNASDQLIDSVRYENDGLWPQEANGAGFSLNLCTLNSDNSLPESWNISLNNTGAIVNGIEIYASPAKASSCPGNPLVKFLGSANIQNEGDGGFVIKIAKDGLGPGAQTVELTVGVGSTSTNGMDFIINMPFTIIFNSAVEKDTQTLVIPLVDDISIEGQEILILTLSNPQKLNILPNFNDYTLTINDNDIVSNEALILTGIFDAQPGGIAGAKGIELYALKDIPDLSIYGIGSANNGGGSDGIEFVFPAISVQQGTYIHIAADSLDFHTYFGFPADYTSSSVNINGNDAIELFEGGGVIDVFGEIDVDGTGQPWDYLDGWAYRKDGTGPDGETFVLNNWKFSGVNALEGFPTNDQATNPFPINTYNGTQDTVTICVDDNAVTDINSAIVIDVLSNDNLPNGVKNLFVNDPLHGLTQVSGSSIIYVPNPGYCGSDIFTYTVLDNKDETAFANVNITVNCPDAYPVYDISTITTNDANGVADSLGVSTEIEGVIYGNDFMGNSNLQFYMIDVTGGISVFSDNSFGYTVKEGDKVVVRGKIEQFAGLTQIAPDTMWLFSTNNPLKTPTIVTELDESTESEFVKILNLHFKDKSQWTTGVGTGFNVDLLDDFGATISMRIDNDVELFNQPPPTFNDLHVTGIGSQFDNSQPFTEGYQILPRYTSDLESSVSTFDPTLQQSVSFQPNIFSNEVRLRTTLVNSKLVILDILGNQLLSVDNLSNGEKVDLSNLSAGIYFARFELNERFWTQKLIKQ